MLERLAESIEREEWLQEVLQGVNMVVESLSEDLPEIKLIIQSGHARSHANHSALSLKLLSCDSNPRIAAYEIKVIC